MHAPRSTGIGLALILCAIPLGYIAKLTANAPNGATLLAVLSVIGGFVLIVVGNERARRDRRRTWPLRMSRGPYVLENVGNVYVFGDTRVGRATKVENGDDLIVLRRFIEGDAAYVLDGDRPTVTLYLARISSGVTA